MARNITALLAAQQVLELLATSGVLAKQIEEGTLGYEFFRDLHRAHLTSSLRELIGNNPALVKTIKAEVEELVRYRTTGNEGAASKAAAAAIVFLLLIAKGQLFDAGAAQELKESLVKAGKELFHELKESDQRLAADLALQLANHDENRDHYVEYLLGHLAIVEELIEDYFEANSPAQLYEAILNQWLSQGEEDTDQLRGLWPLLHLAPAPGDASHAVSLVGAFTMALEGERQERNRKLAIWLEEVAKTHRLIQWEYFTQVDGEFQGQRAKGLPVSPSEPFLEILTNSWWKFVFDYEPTGAGRPLRRKGTNGNHQETLSYLVSRSKTAFETFNRVLLNLRSMAGPTTYHELTQTIRDEWEQPLASGRAGILFVHDAELTFFSLLWLLADHELQLPRFQPNPARFEWEETSVDELLCFLGLAVKASDDMYLLTPRWRSLVRWLRLSQSGRTPTLEKKKERSSCGTDGCFAAEGVYRAVAMWCENNPVPLNRATPELLEAFIKYLHDSVVCGLVHCTPEGRRERIRRGSRAAYLPVETFLRAYRPWSSQLIVVTLNATRTALDLQPNPISYGFATVMGDLPASALEALRPLAEGNSQANAAFHSWLHSHWSLLAGIGMSLGVSPSMASEALSEKELPWVRRLWPDGKKSWFIDNAHIPAHTWREREGEDFSRDIEEVTRYLSDITGRTDFESRLVADHVLWEELKHFVGHDAALSWGQSKKTRGLTLGGVFLLVLVYVHSRGDSVNINVADCKWERTSICERSERGTPHSLKIALQLLTELFPALLYDGARLVIKEMTLGKKDLCLKLDFPCLRPRDQGTQTLWNSLMSAGDGDTTKAIRAYRKLVQAAAELGHAADLVVSPWDDSTTLVRFTAWRR